MFCPATHATHGSDADTSSPADKFTSDSAGTTRRDVLRNTAAMPEDDVSSENNATRSRANDTGISQDDVSARVKQPRQVDISDFLRRKDLNAESAEQSYDLRSKASVTESTTATQHSTTMDLQRSNVDEDDAFFQLELQRRRNVSVIA